MTQKLIVIGGGFTGITVANEVSKTMGPNVEVTVVEKLPDNLCGGVACHSCNN
jgi:protoporphyrinogen oxidase